MKRKLLSLLLFLLILPFHSLLTTFSMELFLTSVTNLPATKVNAIKAIALPQSELLVATDKGVYSTTDRGETWNPMQKGLPEGEVIQVHYQSDPLLILASVKGFGIWKWQPTGKNWVSFNSNLPAKTVNCFFKTEKYLYAGSDREGLFRVKTGAEKWQDLNFDDKNPFLASLAIRDIYFSDEKKGWLATSNGIVITENEGEVWSYQQSNSLSSLSLLSFFVTPDQKWFYCGSENKGLFISQDAGKTWKEWRQTGLPSVPYSAHAIERSSLENRIWVGTNMGLFVSDPSTGTFASIPDLNGKTVLAVEESHSDGWFSWWVGTEKDGLYQSYTTKPPLKPTELSHSIGNKTVLLTWKDSLPGTNSIAGYTIFRKHTEESTFLSVGTSTKPEWIDQDVEWLDSFDYAVQAFDSSNPSIRSVFSDPITVLVDDYPLIEIQKPPQEFETLQESVVIEGKATDEGSGIQRVSLRLLLPSGTEKAFQLSLASDGSFQQSIPLEIGKNLVTITAIDNRSHEASVTRDIIRKEAIKDTVPPVITITSPSNHFSNESDSIAVRGKIIDEEDHLLESRIWVEQNQNRLYYRVLSLDANGIFSETIPIPYGEISIHIQAIDSFGNKAVQIVSGTNSKPDTTPPQFFILSPVLGTETEEEQIRFYGKAWDEESGLQAVRISLDYLSKRMYDKDLSLNEQGFFDLPLSLMEGENYFTLEATDKKKNTAKETRMVFRKAKPKAIMIELVIGKNTALVNGETMTLAYPPEIQKGRTFVPVRFVAEALGANVLWVAQRKEIQITWKEKFISLWLNKTIVTVESLINPDQVPKTLFLETPPYLAKGVTMVPLRLIAEQFGITPQWNPATQTISLMLVP